MSTKHKRKVYRITPKELNKMSANLSSLANEFADGDTTYDDIDGTNYPSYIDLAKGHSMITKGTTSNITNSPIEPQRFHFAKMSSGEGDQKLNKSILKNKSDTSSNIHHQRMKTGTTTGKKSRSRPKHISGIERLKPTTK